MTGTVDKFVCGYDSRRRCRERVEFKLKLGCVHEHIEFAIACRRHADAAKAGAATCYPCSHSSEPHLCKVQMIRRWRRGAS